MKLELKSFVIGVLLTVNVLMLLGLNSNDEESQVGRYQFEIRQDDDYQVYVMDTTDGTLVKYHHDNSINKEIYDNPNRLDGGAKVLGDFGKNNDRR